MTNRNCGLTVCRLIGNLINNNNIAPQNLPSVSDMAEFAEKHNMLPMLYSALTHYGYNCAEFADIAKKADSMSFYQIKTDALAVKLSKKFSEHKIPHMILKGIEYQKYYPTELIRKTSDIDFYVAPKFKNQTENIIISLGFEKKSECNDTVNFAKKPCYYVELHNSFSLENESQNQVLTGIFNNAENIDRYRKSLTNTGNLIYALLHLYKHISASGAGIRMLLDIYLIQKNSETDKSELEKAIQKLNFQKFYNAINSIANYLFEGTEINDNLQNAVDFILNSGTFGNQAFYHKISVSKIEGSHGKKVFKHISNEFGFSAENIKNKYPTAKKHPVTIPYFQVHRVISGLIYKRAAVTDAGKRCKTFKDKDSIKQIDSVMESLGIKNEQK